MTHASLFSGIGGFEIAAQWAGFQNLFWCEKDDFCQRVLKYHFKESVGYGDITTTDFREWNGKINVLSGGFPCQPFSLAGKRRGTEDSRFLWEEMLRAVREIQPEWIIAENVLGLLTQENGMVFERICTDLESESYEVQPFIIPACAVGAPHRRERVWIIANRDSKRLRNGNKNDGEISHFKKRIQDDGEIDGLCGIWIPPNRESDVFQRKCISRQKKRQSNGLDSDANKSKSSAIPGWGMFPTQSPVLRGDDGLSDRLVGITFPCWRRNAIKAYGNAIVPQVAYKLFKAINENRINYKNEI
ncbi:DNA (cytosine-5)-methyltransferase 1 [termite gut metagenome]|uniref:DNA (cytosine-5-)-methyltransferase n=1 Tax=termite gut metagenome TaxID=433724 RepID=A0A5J4STW3_9ZZZZ